ncbi:MAG: dihydroneopterin aldolase [Chryseolinea sp.]
MIARVELEGLEFHAYHGLYAHERETGNWFEVDIAVETDIVVAAVTDELSGTVNYESLFKIVKDEMDKPSKLIETVVEKIVNEVIDQLPAANNVYVKISKINPPIGGKCKKASVSLSRSR